MYSQQEATTVEALVHAGILERPMDGNHGELHPKASDFVKQGIPFIMASNLIDGRVDTKDCAKIPEALARTLRKGFAYTGDVLLSHKATMGRTAIVGKLDVPFLMLTPQVTCYRIRDPERLDPGFLKSYFDGPVFQDVFARWGNQGSTRAYLGITAQLRLPISLPTINEQRAIARIIGALDSKIELNRRTSETLEAMARAIFQSWFVDFEGQGELVDGRMPRGWSSSTLQNHVTLQRGTTYSGNLVGLPGPALLGLGSIEPGGGFRDGHYKTYGGECPEKLILSPGDLFVALKGATKDGSMVGSIARVPPSVASGRLTQDTVKLQFMKPDSGIKCYVYWLLRMPHFRTYCAGRITGSAQVGLSRDDFLSYPVPLPPDTLLAAFSEIESSLSRRQALLAAECKSLADLRGTLLPKLLSGELRVPEAEHAAKL